MAAEGDNGNGKVTLAIIKHDMEGIKHSVDKLSNLVSEVCNRYDKRFGELEIGQAQRREQIDNLKDDVDKLEAKSNTWSVINSTGVVGAIVTTIIAMLRGS